MFAPRRSQNPLRIKEECDSGKSFVVLGLCFVYLYNKLVDTYINLRIHKTLFSDNSWVAIHNIESGSRDAQRGLSYIWLNKTCVNFANCCIADFCACGARSNVFAVFFLIHMAQCNHLFEKLDRCFLYVDNVLKHFIGTSPNWSSRIDRWCL